MVPTPREGAHDPCKFFSFGASSQNTGKCPNIKNFGRGGGLRGPKILYSEILRVFFCALIEFGEGRKSVKKSAFFTE